MFKGFFCPIVTLFGEDGRIDYDAEVRHIERLITEGVDGILFGGSIGEFPALTDDEKRELFAWAVKTINRRVTTLAGTGGANPAEVMALTRYCRDVGMDGTVLISPYYFQLNEGALYDYYIRAADIGLPVILYNFPQRTNVSLSPRLIARLAGDHQMIVGVKDTVDTMSHTRETIAALHGVRDDFSVLSGFDEYFIPNLMSGGAGVLSGLTNIVPGLFRRVISSFSRKDFNELVTLQGKLNEWMRIYQMTDPFVTAIKHAVSLIIPNAGGAVRAPFLPITDDEKQSVEAFMRCAAQP